MPVRVAEVAGVGLGHADHDGVERVCLVGQLELLHLAQRERLERRIGQRPEFVVVAREELEPHPHGVRVGHHVRAPVVEDLQAAHLDAGVLDVDPVVGYQVRPRIDRRRGLAQLPIQHANGDEVAVLQLGADAAHAIRHVGLHRHRQILDGHRRDDMVGAHPQHRAIHLRGDRLHAVAVALDADHLRIADDAAAAGFEALRRRLPHLARAQLRVQEVLDQRRLILSAARLAGHQLLQRMGNHVADVEALDALRAPRRTDLVAGHAPHLLGVGLEELQVQRAPEAVDEEVLERDLGGDRRHVRAAVAERELRAFAHAELRDHVQAGAQRIVEERAIEVDA